MRSSGRKQRNDQMRMCSIASGSSGNCIYIGTDATHLLVDVGISCKTIYDCTVPFHLREHFRRAEFLEVDPHQWLKEW